MLERWMFVKGRQHALFALGTVLQKIWDEYSVYRLLYALLDEVTRQTAGLTSTPPHNVGMATLFNEVTSFYVKMLFENAFAFMA